MACSDCKKKKQKLETLKTPHESAFKTDKIISWVIVVWFFLGLYGIWSLVEKIINL